MVTGLRDTTLSRNFAPTDEAPRTCYFCPLFLFSMQPTQALESTLTRDAAIFDIIEQEKWRQTKAWN